MRQTSRTSTKASILVLTVMLSSFATPASPSESTCDLPEDEQPPASEPFELCGATTITRDAATVARVTLVKTATINPEIGPMGGIQIEGEGPFVGVGLIEEPPSPQASGFIAAKAATESSGTTFIGFGLLEGCSPCTLSAGDYRLYLMTGAGSTRVSLDLAGLTGSVTLNPIRPTGFQAGEFTRRVELTDDLVGATSGDTFDLASPGFLYRGIRLVGVDVTATGVFECTTGAFPGHPPVCVEGNVISGGSTWVGQRQNPSVTDSELVQPGRYTQGAWFASPVPPSRVDTLGAWLSFD